MTAPLSLVHVVRQYAPSIGGMESVVASLAAEQIRRGHDVRVVTLDRIFRSDDRTLPTDETVDGIPLRRLPWRGSPRYPLCPRVIGALAGADCVHVHGVDFFYDFLAVTRFLHRKPLVASTHGGFFHTRFAALGKVVWFHTVTRIASLGYRRIVADSDSDHAMFSRIAGARVETIENGVDLGPWQDAASSTPLKVILSYGRWSSNKGLRELFNLFAAVRVRSSGWRLIVAGRPYDLSAADLQRFAHDLGVSDAVEIHESPSKQSLRTLMGRASYFASLSRYEGFGVAAIEAMGAGLFPILGDIPPFRKLLNATGRGILVEPGGEVAGAAALIERHRHSADDWSRDRAELQRTARSYDWARVADRFDEVYANAIRTAAPQPLVVR